MHQFKDDHISAFEAKFEAQKIAFAPVVFQTSRVLRDLNILEEVGKTRKAGASLEQIAENLGLPKYGVSVLLDLGLSIGLVHLNDNRFVLSKIGHFVKNDPMTRVNMNFVQDICYKGLYNLEESILEQKPAGLKELGDWSTIYEGLSKLPEKAKKSWFDFDHYYSDTSFKEIIPIVFKNKPKVIFDAGGNTGKWAKVCVDHDPTVKVTILDLPGQIGLAQNNIKDHANADRISFYPVNFLDNDSAIPEGADIIWMSQFLDCFSEEQIVSIIDKAKKSMSESSSLLIMDTYWDRQVREASTFCLNSTSIYFTAMANGNSRMYHSKAMLNCIKKAGLRAVNQIDQIGLSHTIIECKL
ncbi:MAG: SAM-dependent methyltransferase [Crocinitomicaceae bacterium]|nr:SAM-dependent methyltransferase [Crocinitomicaceae bacterium]|tara:strand:- start:5311 stop:6375 length:1065 start_codon:yes stop_codon:yes gene_type:complete